MSTSTHSNRRRLGLSARVAGVVVIGAFILAACVPEPAPDPNVPLPPPQTTPPPPPGPLYGDLSGTSMASPVAAAAAALLLAKCPDLTPADVEARLTSTADPDGEAGIDSSFGAGLLNPGAIVSGACPTSSAAVAPPQPTPITVTIAETPAPEPTPTTATTAPATTTATAASEPADSSATTSPTTSTTASSPTTSTSAAPTTTTTSTTTSTTTTTTTTASAPTTTTAPAPDTSVVPDPSAPCVGAAAPASSADAYFAVVEDAHGHRHVESFTASDRGQKDAKVQRLRDRGLEVVDVERDSEVVALEIDDPVYSGPPASPYGPQWWVKRMGFEAAWGPSLAQGAGVRVAVIDSGVEADHEDLGRVENGGNVAPGADCLSSTVVGDERTDSGHHGTHVAGIVAARDNTKGGVGGAPAATIVPVRVLNGGSGSMANVVAGIYWAADPTKGNVDVINLSLGAAGESQSLKDALQYAVFNNVVVFAAAGNCGCTTQSLYPAAYAPEIDGVIAVAATAERVAVTFPSTGSGTITAWLKAPGAGVAKGEVIATALIGGNPVSILAPEAGNLGATQTAVNVTVNAGAAITDLVDLRASFSTIASYVTIAAPGAKITSTLPGHP